jgi:hypothetical protein
MSELVDTRCSACSPKAYQCSRCATSDIALRRTLKKSKKAASFEIPSTPVAFSFQEFVSPPAVKVPSTPVASSFQECVSPPAVEVPSTPVASSFQEFVSPPAIGELWYDIDHQFPAMPSPLHLSVGGKVLYPPSGKLKRHRRNEFALTDTESSDSDSSSDTDAVLASQADCNPKPLKMSRITQEERNHVSVWIAKRRSDDKMTNGKPIFFFLFLSANNCTCRWIRNGGAKGATMTATSGEVKTSGAYDALATYKLGKKLTLYLLLCRYINKRMKFEPAHPKFWTRDICKKRWKAMYCSTCCMILCIHL